MDNWRLDQIEKQLEQVQERINRYNPSAWQKLLFTILFCFAIVTIVGYFALLMGVDYFLLPLDNMLSNTILDDLLCDMLFIVNMFFMVGFCVKSSLKKHLCYAVAYIPIIMFTSTFFSGTFISTAIVPLAYTCLIFAIAEHDKTKHDVTRFVVKLIAFNAAVLLYQIPTTAFKLNLIDGFYHISHIGFSAKLFFSFDQFIFFLVLLLIGGEIYEVNARRLESLACTEGIQSVEFDHEDLEQIDAINNMSLARRTKAIVLLGFFQLIQVFMVLAVCYLGNVFIEAAFIMFAYLASIVVIRKRWHSDAILVCTLTSITLFYVASKATIPVQYSMFIPLIVGVIISYSLYLMAVKSDELEWLRALAYFDVNSCTKDQLIERCKIVGVKEKDWDFCVAMFIDKMKAEQAADAFFIEVQSVKNKKGRLAKKLNRPK